MPSFHPLNSHLQDAVAGHNAKSGVGALQKSTTGAAAEHRLIELGYVPVRQLTGKVVGIWGDAQIRHLDGHVTVLHVGDVVKKGEVVLTAQDGIVQIEARHVAAAPSASDDVERAITQVAQGDATAVPAAGAGLGSSLEEGLRVGRDAEAVTPLAFDLAAPAVPVQPPEVQAVTPLGSAPVAAPDIDTTPVNTPVVFDARSNDTSTSALTIVNIAGQAISEGHPVTLPQGSVALNPDGTLTFTPNHNFTGSLTFTYGEQNTTGATATSTVTIDVVAPPIAAKPDTNTVPENGSTTGSLAGDATQVPGDPNTFTVATPPGHGALALNPDGTYTYTPTTGYSGPDSFTYTVTDTNGQTSTATVTLTVAPAPIAAQPDTNTVPENGSTAGSLAGDATQVPGDPNTFTVATPPGHGTLTLNPDGSYTYAPATGYTGTDSFTYAVTDASGQTSTATVTLTVNPLPVTARPDANAGPENTPITGSVAGDASSVAGDPNTFTAGSQPTHGTVVVNADGSYTYTPATGYAGPDSFTYVVTDHSGATSTATVTLTVTPAALAAKDDANHGPENSPISGSVAADVTQIPGDPNTFTLGNGAAHGTVVVNPDGTYTYTPTTGYTGPDSFSYVVTDKSGATTTATVTLTVEPLPVAAKDDVNAGPENTPISGSVAADASTVAGDPNTFTAGSQPAHGTVVVNADGSYTYTPTTGYSGTDSFTYVVTDHSGATSTATVTLTVTPAALAAKDDANTGNENSTITGSIAADATQIPGDPNTFAAGTLPTHGTVVVNADGSYSYTPVQGYTGPDSFTYVVTDKSGATATATVSLTVVPLPITARDDSNSGNENSVITGSVANDATNVPGDPNTFALGNGAAHGNVVVNPDGSYTYTPATGYSGPDSFTYVVTDHSGATSTATVTLSVNPLGFAAAPDTNSGNENSPISGSVAADVTQTPGDPATFTLGSVHPAHGSVTVNADGSYTYTPNSGYTGTDSFTYTATNASGQVATATVSLTVVPLPITANNDHNSGPENSPISGALTADASTVAGDPNTFAAGSQPAHGTVVVNADGSYTYTPATGYSGPDSFTYVVTDHSGATSSATVALTVTPLAIAAKPDTGTGTENSPIAGSVSGDATSIPGDPNTFTLGSVHPAHGTVVVNADGSYTYTPTTGYTGPDSFSYVVTDHSGATSTATVALTVVPLPIAAKDDSNSGAENSVITGSVAADATAIPGDPNTFTLGGTHPAHGSVVVNADGSYTYTPTTGYSGTDSFTYVVTDHSGATSTATVHLTVNPLGFAAAPDANSGNENSPISGTVAADVTQIPGDPATFTLGSLHPAHGTVTVNADGSYTYTPTTGYSGPDSFTYTATNASGQVATATVTLTVVPLPIAAKDDSNSGPENSVISGTVVGDASVVAGDPNTFKLGNDATHGHVVVNADGSYSYTPTTGYSGTDSFSYTVTDHSGQTSTATVTLTVTPLAFAAAPDHNSVNENGAVSGTVANDVTQIPGDAATFKLGSDGTHGHVVVNGDGSYTYTPTQGYTGTDSFTYTATNASGQVSTATVTLTVVPLPITAKDDSNSGPENSVISGTVVGDASVVAGDPNTFKLGNDAAHGHVVVNADGSYSYTPAPGYSGTDSFSYTVTDHSGATSTATVNLTVTPLAITAKDDSGTGPENSPISGSVAADATAIAGDPNSFTLGSVHPAHGTVVVHPDGSYTYTPTTGYTGTDSFTYTVTDHSGATSTATVHLTVTPLAIAAKDDSNTVNENGTVAGSVAADATAIPGDPNTFTLGSVHPAHGAVSVNADGTYTYTPTAGYSGTDSFSYVVTDRSGATSTATVTLTVVPINPVAKPDVYTTNEDTPLTGQTVASNDTPVAGETNAWAVTGQPAHGTLVLAADFATSGKFTYTPSANWSGTDTFTYTITDGSGHTSSTTATINVVAVADAPTLAITDKAYLAATDLEEVTLLPVGATYNDAPASGLGSGSGTTTATHAGVWQTDNAASNGGAAHTVEVGLGTLYGIKNADGTNDTSHVIELEQNLNDVGNLYTTMATKAGEVYNLSFDYAARAGNTTSSIIYVYWEGQLVDTLNTQSTTITHVDLQLLASVTGTGKLEFIAGDSSSYGGVLDNITLGLAHDTGVQGYVVNLPAIASGLVDTDGSESLKTVIDAIPVGATLTDGTHTFTATAGTTSVDVSAWTLGSLSLTPTASFSGDITLGVHATSTEASNGSTATTDGSVTLHVLSDAAGLYGTTGNDTMSITDATTSASSIRWGLDGNDSITGSIGHDTLIGGAGNDTLIAGSGSSLLSGGTGNDSLVGGAGNDTLEGGASAMVNGVMGHNTLTGGAGSDTFRWSLIDPELVHPGDTTPLKAGDPGTEGHAFQDVITDFNNATPANGGDVLDLRDLLVGELKGGATGSGNLTNYLHFETVGSGATASTVIHISSHGDFASGYSASAEDTTITLQNVNLHTSATTTDAQIIATLIGAGKLVVDGQ